MLLMAGAMLLAGCKKPGVAAVDASGRQDNAGQKQDFTSIEYYGPPNPTQMKTRLTGADAEPLENGLIAFKQLKLETFAVSGRTQFIAEAPDCVYDAPNGTANSSGHLQLASGDGKIRVEGDGFLWRRSDSLLTISNNVKTLIASILIATNGGLNVHAQTNLDTTTNVTTISSHSVNFNMNTRTAIYRGDVRVDNPQMKLTCGQIIATLPPSGGRPDHIVAETNVVIDFTDEGQTNHVTCDKAIYDYSVENGMTNETAIFTGHARAKIAHNAIIIGEPLGWNPEKGFFATNETMIFPQGLESLKGETNLPLIK